MREKLQYEAASSFATSSRQVRLSHFTLSRHKSPKVYNCGNVADVFIYLCTVYRMYCIQYIYQWLDVRLSGVELMSLVIFHAFCSLVFTDFWKFSRSVLPRSLLLPSTSAAEGLLEFFKISSIYETVLVYMAAYFPIACANKHANFNVKRFYKIIILSWNFMNLIRWIKTFKFNGFKIFWIFNSFIFNLSS